MNELHPVLDAVLGTIADVLPIALVILVFQVLVLRRRPPNAARLALGFGYVVVGLGLFLLGLEQALFPLGRLMAAQLTDVAFLAAGRDSIASFGWLDYYWVYVFAFALGLAATIAEPALMAVAIKAREVSGGSVKPTGLRLAVAVGAASGIALGTFRIVAGHPLHWYIIAGYLVVVAQTFVAPRSIIPLAYDSGGVTTSTVTVPLVAALGLGLAETVPGRNPIMDGFGLIAFACLFPIISVMGYAQIAYLRDRRRHRRAHFDDRIAPDIPDYPRE